MKTKRKSLQKLTETEIKINKILSLEQINQSDLAGLNKSQNARLMAVLTEKFNAAKGTERDKFYNKIEPIIGAATKNQLWENNHNEITNAITSFIQDYGRMPSKNEIASNTNLSRQTIHKHFKEYLNHPLYVGQVEQFRFMTSKLLAKVFQFALKGDTAAAKLYLTAIGSINGQHANNTLIQNQNNYIQINGMVLSQETIKLLTAEQLNIIESILKTALPQPENASIK